MEPLKISGTEDSPNILFDSVKGVFEISGRSLPEDCVEFYNPVLEWLEKYSRKPNVVTEFVFRLEYMNTASSKLIQDITFLLEKINGTKIIWCTVDDDEDMVEIGRELSEIVSIPFQFKSF